MLKDVIDKMKKCTKYPRKIEKRIPCISLGSGYGSFGVALGYLKKDMKVLSFGIGEDVSFDQALIRDHNAEIYAFDPTPRSIKWVKTQGIENERFHFFAIGIARKSGRAAFHLPVNETSVSGSLITHKGVRSEPIEVEMYDFADIYKMTGLNGDIDILKMDIEGTEFEVLPDILKYSKEKDITIRQICLEWHGRFYKHGNAKIKKMCGLLRDHGYSLVYISGKGETNTFVKAETIGS